MSEKNSEIPAAEQYLSELEGALKRTPGVVPAEALADAREFLDAETNRLRGRIPDERIHQRFGQPEEVAAAYAAGEPPVCERPGYAPGWRVMCIRCGRSAPADCVGIVRTGAWSVGKCTIGWCRRCRFFTILRLVKDLPEPTSTGGDTMKPTHILSVAIVLAAAVAFFVSGIQGTQPAEPFLGRLPPGLFLKDSTVVSAERTRTIGKRLDGDIERLTNSHLQVHGRPIQVNAITAVDESNAKAIQTSLSKIKSFPFCLRKGRIVIEYVGEDIDEALATKTSYELGLLDKPDRVRYRVTAEMATVEKADYMACNPLFNHFLALRNGPNEDTIRQINELSRRFEFGRSLTLRNPDLGNESAMHKFKPLATAADKNGATVSYSFDRLPDRQDVPYVTVTMEITVDNTGLRKSPAAPSKTLTAATPFWPADDPGVKALAQRITRGKSTNDEKALAILQWLAPGKNLQYSGRIGSRWGAAQVLEQKFGHCWDFADCFVTLSRAAGVPSREVAGWLYGSSGHVWAEFYREGKGWQQVDPTGGGTLRCGIYHIPYLTSEDGKMPVVYLSMPKIEAVRTN